MGGAVGFIWALVVILGLAWALIQTGTVNVGINFGLWIHVLLGLALLGVVFNLFVAPFLNRERETTSSSTATRTGTRGGGVAHRETTRETHERTV